MADHLHIVSFDVPYPADYGGVVDVFYKIKALHELGVHVHLHCFEYGRGQQPELEKYCVEVCYYSRQEGHKGFSLQLPYIVASRNDEQLWKRLNADDYPVLFEGVHCTYGLTSGAICKKNIAVRLHNTEFEYYTQLGKWETSLARKAYMQHESRLLKRYEEKLKDYLILSLSNDDCATYRKIFKASNIHYLPAFIPSDTVTSKTGKGAFILYHGDLSVSENEKTAVWLVKKIFHDLDIPFVIAGKNPSEKLINLLKGTQKISIVINPNEASLINLIEDAQVNVLPSQKNAGSSLNIFNTLFRGRFLISNRTILSQFQLETICQPADNITEYKYHIYRLFNKQYTTAEIERKKASLETAFNNMQNAKKMMKHFS